MAENEKRATERELPERWSAQRKTEVVLRIIKGEDLGVLSSEIQVPAHEGMHCDFFEKACPSHGMMMPTAAPPGITRS